MTRTIILILAAVFLCFVPLFLVALASNFEHTHEQLASR